MSILTRKFSASAHVPAAIASVSLLFGCLAQAQTGASSAHVSSTYAEVDAFWTPQRVLSATTQELHPQVGLNGLPKASAIPADGTPKVSAAGARPTQTATPYDVKTLVPAAYLNQAEVLAPAPGVIPDATSSFGAFFTTGRVFPDSAAGTYPYLTAGRLLFTDPKTNKGYVCSASVLRQRVVVTAGHCVANASTNASQRYFYTNFLFVPAYSNGVGPVGSWTANTAWVTNAWYQSDGSVPNPQDVAMLVMNDRSGKKIWTYTGYLGYTTNGLANNNVTMLGYPCNLDNCERMEITGAQTFTSGGNNTYIFGSAMRGGASGGPWIQDFGVNPSSSPAVSLGLNYLVAVTSYGPVATAPAYLGASVLDSRFTTLLTSACAGAGNCTN